MANRFILNETSYHGAGAIKSIADEAKGRSFKKAFVCSDPDLVKFGVTKRYWTYWTVPDFLMNCTLTLNRIQRLKMYRPV